jgi:peptide/nickel transport system substrate-binding protein
MNTTMAPWSDVHVRRAVAYALNRSDIIAAYGGPLTATPASSLISPAELATIGTQAQVSAVFSSVPQYPYDLGKARQEMAQSAYPHGFTATTTIDNGGAGPNGPNVDQVIAAELHKIGITLKISEVPASQYFSDYDNAPGGDLYAQFGAVSPDPSVFPSYCLGSAATLNVAHYVNKSISTLLADGLATSSPARRLAIYEQVLKQVATDVPYVVLFSPNAFTALSSKYTLPPFFVYPGFFSWALHLRLAA